MRGMPVDIEAVRRDFPILARQVHGKRLVYLDNAATTQKPAAVIEALDRYYRNYNANVHRSVHKLAEEATLAYESARQEVARFLNAARPEEVVFTSGTTEALNLVAYAWGRANVRAGDAIVYTDIEHHSNLVPWQLLAEAVGAEIRVVEVDLEAGLDLDRLEAVLDERVRLVTLPHISNVLGLELPVAEVARRAHQVGAVVVVDAAQSAPQQPIDVQALGCDFLALSGHKLYGPTGIGVLWGRYELLAAMPPFMGGGEMIRRVGLTRSTFADPPARFEAGTPKIAGAIGLGAAVEYLEGLGMDRVAAHDRALAAQAHEALLEVPGVTVYGPPPDRRAGLVAFSLDDIHAHDLASLVDTEGVAIRAGHHCCMPLHDRLGVPATARASFAVYNGPDDIEALVRAVHAARKVFNR